MMVEMLFCVVWFSVMLSRLFSMVCGGFCGWYCVFILVLDIFLLMLFEYSMNCMLEW